MVNVHLPQCMIYCVFFNLNVGLAGSRVGFTFLIHSPPFFCALALTLNNSTTSRQTLNLELAHCHSLSPSECKIVDTGEAACTGVKCAQLNPQNVFLQSEIYEQTMPAL